MRKILLALVLLGLFVTTAHAQTVHVVSGTPVTLTCTSQGSTTTYSVDVFTATLGANTTYVLPAAASNCSNRDHIELFIEQAANSSFTVTVNGGAGTSIQTGPGILGGVITQIPSAGVSVTNVSLHQIWIYDNTPATPNWKLMLQETNPIASPFILGSVVALTGLGQGQVNLTVPTTVTTPSWTLTLPGSAPSAGSVLAMANASGTMTPFAASTAGQMLYSTAGQIPAWSSSPSLGTISGSAGSLTALGSGATILRSDSQGANAVIQAYAPAQSIARLALGSDNASGTIASMWSVESMPGGATATATPVLGAFNIKDLINGKTPLSISTADVVTFATPLPVGSGGTSSTIGAGSEWCCTIPDTATLNSQWCDWKPGNYGVVAPTFDNITAHAEATCGTYPTYQVWDVTQAAGPTSVAAATTAASQSLATQVTGSTATDQFTFQVTTAGIGCSSTLATEFVTVCASLRQ